jgi:hypothetical protein
MTLVEDLALLYRTKKARVNCSPLPSSHRFVKIYLDHMDSHLHIRASSMPALEKMAVFWEEKFVDAPRWHEKLASFASTCFRIHCHHASGRSGYSSFLGNNSPLPTL